MESSEQIQFIHSFYSISLWCYQFFSLIGRRVAGVNSETHNLCLTISRGRNATPVFQGGVQRLTLIGLPGIHIYSLSMARIKKCTHWRKWTKAHPWSWKWGLIFPEYVAAWESFGVLHWNEYTVWDGKGRMDL